MVFAMEVYLQSKSGGAACQTTGRRIGSSTRNLGAPAPVSQAAGRRGGLAMLRLGYKLMSEEHGPKDLVENAERAEKAGFDFAAISDHFFPWIEEQGH